jgi:hypothetical protein
MWIMRVISIFISIILAIVFISVVLASGLLTDDTYSNVADPLIPHGNDEFLNASSGGLDCTILNEIFLQWDLSDIQIEVSNEITPTILGLEAVFEFGASATGSLELWSTSDSWDETTLTYDSTPPDKPLPISLLATLALPQADGPVSFSSNELNAYINQESAYTGGGDTIEGDNIASFIIRIDGCSPPSNQIFFASSEETLGPAPFLDAFGPADLQDIELNQGWNMISSFIEPANPNMWDVFGDVQNDLVLVKNGDGIVFWPEYNINDIGDWVTVDGYQVYMTTAQTLTITGTRIIPANTPLVLSSGWNLIAFLGDEQIPIESGLADLDDTIVLAKNNTGKVYWPAYGINDIGNLIPGQGYQVYLNEQDTLVYP